MAMLRIKMGLMLIIIVSIPELCFSSEIKAQLSVENSQNIQFWAFGGSKYKYTPTVNQLDSDAIGLMAKERWQEAVSKFDLSIKEMPNNPRARANRAFCYKSLGKLDLAVADYNKALAIAPEWQEHLLLDRGRILVDLGDLKSAESDFNKAKKFPANRAQAFSELSYIATTQQNYNKCAALASEAIKADKRYSDGWANRGACRIGLAHYANAVDDLSQAIKLSPNFVSAYINRIGAYRALGDCKNALVDANTVMRLAPSAKGQVERMVAGCSN